ncbi:MAG: DNA integrity scanning protein DisA nucleotide-binding domain protein [Myxococcales bacterium]|nr:DNA integrity scanning protein DisA nucleotide-binding domain protein [Myxococcales bacterium]
MKPSEFIAALAWNDALDFGLLLVIFYGTLRLLHGTRAIPVLLSVAFFGAVAATAQALDLVAVAALIKFFLEYIIIILIVVFHQEIRRLLLRVGQRLAPRGRRQAALSAVGELVLAMERLKRAKIGALFILRGEIDILDLVSDRGREIGADLHADTLVALMIPHPINLAHDGAVLIQDFRIIRAGVICPLTHREDLDPQFGTRHRGAIGMTEETDALMLVVSEERGEIRVAFRGELSEPLNAAELEKRIGTWIEQPPEPDDDVEPKVTGDPGRSSGARRVEADLQHPAEGGA